MVLVWSQRGEKTNEGVKTKVRRRRSEEETAEAKVRVMGALRRTLTSPAEGEVDAIEGAGVERLKNQRRRLAITSPAMR